jgi:hypothetical protein
MGHEEDLAGLISRERNVAGIKAIVVGMVGFFYLSFKLLTSR